VLWAGIVTLFPELFAAFGEHGVARRAVAERELEWAFYNPRNFTQRKQGQVDDRPYGGGPGMVMQAEPLTAAVAAAQSQAPAQCRVVLPSPAGRPLTQALVRELSKEAALIFVCGRYEGIDERFVAQVDDEISLGDYVLTGGELPVLVMLDAICRWLPGTLGNADSAINDSFVDGLLEGPHYTRPELLSESEDGGQAKAVPAVLLGGDHAKIARWHRIEALRRTLTRRPELLLNHRLSREDQALLREILSHDLSD